MGRRPGPNRKDFRDVEWMNDAACREAPTELFHAPPPEEWDPADRSPERVRGYFLLQDLAVEDYCVECPVRPACRTYGESEAFGIWGGLTEQDRRAGTRTHRKYRDPDRPTPTRLARARTALLRRRQARYLERLGIA